MGLDVLTFILSSAKFLLMISTDDGTFEGTLLFIGFKVETNVVIHASSVPVTNPVWIFRMLFVLRVLKVRIWGSSDHLFSPKFDGGFQ